MQLSKSDGTSSAGSLNDATTNAMAPTSSLNNDSPGAEEPSQRDANDSFIIDHLLEAAELVHDSPIVDCIVDLVPCFIEAFREVRENRQLLRILAMSCHSAILALHGSCKRSEAKSEWIARNWHLIGGLYTELNDVQIFLKEMRQKKMFLRLLTTRADKRKIQDYIENLRAALKRFKVASHLDINEGLDEARRQNQEIKNLLLSMSRTSSSSTTESSLSPLTLESPSADSFESNSTSTPPDDEEVPVASSSSSIHTIEAHAVRRPDVRTKLDRLEAMVEELKTSQRPGKKSNRKQRRRPHSEEDESVSESGEESEEFHVEVPKKKGRKPNRKKPNRRDDRTESQQGPPTAFNHFSYVGGWPANYAYVGHAPYFPQPPPPPPVPPAPLFPVDPSFSTYTGFTMPGISFSHSMTAGSSPFTSTPGHAFASHVYMSPDTQRVGVVSNAGSGNVSYSTVSNIGNDYSLNHSVKRERRRDAED